LATFTIINGKAYSHASCEISILGKPRLFVKELKYTDSLEPGEVRGTSAQLLARTRGDYKAESSITFWRGGAEEVREDLGDGWMEQEFDVIVTMQEDGLSTIVDTIAKCRAKKSETGSSQGSDANEESWDLHPMYILKNGWNPIYNLVKG
jgi:hypothetical protein